MPRTYTKSKRAENEAETRERIADAALSLHTELGPAQTTISQIAERAGVQRHTVYAHFPDERAILMACSGLHMEREPLPVPEHWAEETDPAERIRRALAELYGWYERNAQLAAAFLRDAEHNTVLREVNMLRMGPVFAAIHASLSGGLGNRGNAALALALNFYTWRTLTRDAGMTSAAAVDLMVDTVLSADD